MVAQRGDETEETEMEVEEIRTVRLLDRTVDLADNETVMDLDRARGEENDDRERTRASGRGNCLSLGAFIDCLMTSLTTSSSNTSPSR